MLIKISKEKHEYLLFIGIFIILIITIFKLDLNYLYKKNKLLQEKIIALNTAILTSKQKIHNFTKLSNNATKKFTTINFNFDQYLAEIDNIANKSHVKIILLKPFVMNSKVNSTIATAITIKGNYQELVKFIFGVKSIKYLTLFNNLSLKKISDDQDELLLEGVLYSYEYAINSKIFYTNNISQLHNPFNFVVEKNKNKKLTNFACNQFKFIGLIKQHNKNDAVLIDPLGHVFQVGLGDKIGLNKNKIIRIKRDTIILDNNYNLIRVVE